MKVFLERKRFFFAFFMLVALLTLGKLILDHGFFIFGALSGLHEAPLYRLAAFITIIGSAEWFRGSLQKFHNQRTHRSWWLPPGGGATPPKTWTEVLSQASLDWDNDPIRRADLSERRGLSPPELAAFCAAIALTVCIFSIVMDYIFDPHVPGLLMFQAGSIAKPNKINLGNLIEATTNLTAYLAIVTAGIALYVARFTLRAQVRSKSRQEWIDRFRSLIAAISSQVDRKFRADTEFKLGEVNEKIIHLELMLNPSEKDHRVLAMLLRICVHDQAPVEADKNLQAELASLKPDNVPEGSRDLLMFLAAKTVPGDDVSHGKAISYIVRLSNIILKREWMRVREIE